MAKRKVAKKRASRKAGAKKRSHGLATPKRRSAAKALAGTVHPVKEPLVDVTADVRETIVAAPPPKAETPKRVSPLTAQERHELDAHFERSLRHEPEQKGLLKRLFRKHR